MKNKICAIFGVCIFIIAQSEIVFGQVNIQEIINDGGISGFLSGVIAIVGLYLLGYPLFFVVNLIRLRQCYEGTSLNKIAIQATNDNLNEFIPMVLVALFFVIPLSTIPVVIILAGLSGLSSFVLGTRYGDYLIELLIIYCLLALIVSFFYSFIKTIKSTELEKYQFEKGRR